MIPPHDEPQWLTSAEFAKVVNKSPRQVNRLCRSGAIHDFGLPVYAGPKWCRGRKYFIFTPSTMMR